MRKIIGSSITTILLLAGCSSGVEDTYYPEIEPSYEPAIEEIYIPYVYTPTDYEYTFEEPIFEEPPPPPPPPEPEFLFDDWVAGLSIEEKIGQLFMLRLPWQTLYVNEAVENLFEAIPMGGVILFADNIALVPQVQELTADLQELSRVPLLIATDEEGGRVSRAGRLFSSGAAPAAYSIGMSLYATSEAFEMGRYVGNELLNLGINMNFAPVADIWSNPANAVIGNRAFGRTADAVAPLVETTVMGLHEGGVMAVLKHFPGHSATYEDSHYQLAFHRHSLDRFRAEESLPFASGIAAGADGIMIAHISTPEIGGHTPLLYWMYPWIESGYLPATFSDFWLQEILRGEMGFNGLIITDALEMRALTDHFSCGQIALGAFLAGADILLMPHREAEAFHAMLQAFHDGVFTEERLLESLERIFMAKF
jgi:beta-N-acetylhexosaminidase